MLKNQFVKMIEEKINNFLNAPARLSINLGDIKKLKINHEVNIFGEMNLLE